MAKSDGRQGMAQELLPGAHDQRHLQGEDLRRAVPALDHRACTGTRTRSRKPASIRKSRRRTGTRCATMSAKLVKKDGGNVTRWGVMIPSTAIAYWMFQAFARQNGQDLMTPDGTRTNFTHPDVVEALQYWVDLGRKHNVMPAGIVDWGTYARTSSSARSRSCGHDRQPHRGARQRQVPVRRGHDAGEQAARLAHRRRQFLRLQEIHACAGKAASGVHEVDDLARAGGQVVASPPAMSPSARGLRDPGMQTTSRSSRRRPSRATSSTRLGRALDHENRRVTKALNDGLQAALTGSKTAAAAMKDAAGRTERILKKPIGDRAAVAAAGGPSAAPRPIRGGPWRAHATAPAHLRLAAAAPAAVLLGAFTHFPAVATLIESFFSTPKGRGRRASSASTITPR